ncbi:MAG: HEPN domain-containing protein [Candidatus Kariarchaeaceae archaeon]
MSHSDEVNLLLKRGKNFLEGAKQRFDCDDWDLTCFLAEQSVNLFLKAKILEFTGTTPKIHSLRQLISIVNTATEADINYERNQLVFLEGAYLTSRYMNFIYEKEDEERAIIIAEELTSLVKNIKS